MKRMRRVPPSELDRARAASSPSKSFTIFRTERIVQPASKSDANRNVKARRWAFLPVGRDRDDGRQKENTGWRRVFIGVKLVLGGGAKPGRIARPSNAL